MSFQMCAPRMIDEVHIMNARRTGRHTGKARQTAVDMFDRFRIRRSVVFQHILDEVNAAARAIQLVSQNLIGWACRRAKPTVHAGSQKSRLIA